jgi:pyruvate dehydrogenase E2 component (dihydrolipoamide acetyltransferase)
VKEPIGLPPASLPPEGIPIAAPPSLRKLAMQIGLDLTSIPGGYVTWEDVRRYVQSLQAQAASVGPKAQAPSASSKVDFARWGPIRREKLSLVRRTIAQAMEDAWRTIPHVTQFHEADIGRALEWLKQHDAAYQQKGIRLTLTVLILKAVAGLLKKHPIFNASLDEATQEVIYKEYVHLGVAVDTEAGLMVPVLRDVDKKDVGTIALELHQLVEKARTRKVTLDELMGASFTVSNQGGIGGGHFTPIIHKPEAAILGVGRAVLRPVYLKEDEPPSPRWMLPLALSYDHRLADGADAARFVRDLAQTLEHFGEPME